MRERGRRRRRKEETRVREREGRRNGARESGRGQRTDRRTRCTVHTSHRWHRVGNSLTQGGMVNQRQMVDWMDLAAHITALAAGLGQMLGLSSRVLVIQLCSVSSG